MKNIFCPSCGQKMFNYDGKSTMTVDRLCKNCNMIVVYNPNTNKTKIMKPYQRATSSGKRFY